MPPICRGAKGPAAKPDAYRCKVIRPCPRGGKGAAGFASAPLPTLFIHAPQTRRQPVLPQSRRIFLSAGKFIIAPAENPSPHAGA